MVYSLCWKGKVLDYHYKPIGINHTAFYVGDIYVGQLFKNTGRLKYWTAVANTPRPNGMHSVSGFGTRWKACEWLLKAEGYHTNESTESDMVKSCKKCHGRGYTITHRPYKNGSTMIRTKVDCVDHE